MKKTKSFHIALCFVSINLLLTSCTKELPPSSTDQEAQNAIQEIRKIIGSEGEIKLVGKSENYSLNNQSKSMGLPENSIRKISIDEFKKVYNVFKNKEVSFNVIKESKLNSSKNSPLVKANSSVIIGEDTYDEYDGDVFGGTGGPRQAGVYNTTFKSEFLEYYFRGYVDGNNPLLLSNINVQYRTDGTGRIIGMPSLYFTGFSIFNWTQNQSHLLSYDSRSFKSVFLITGITNYNISFGPFVFNVSSSKTFKIVLYMDDSSITIARIEILESENQTM